MGSFARGGFHFVLIIGIASFWLPFTLMRVVAVDASNIVNLFNVETGAQWTATLSVARGTISATTVGNLVLFGGGGDSERQCINLHQPL